MINKGIRKSKGRFLVLYWRTEIINLQCESLHAAPERENIFWGKILFPACCLKRKSKPGRKISPLPCFCIIWTNKSAAVCVQTQPWQMGVMTLCLTDLWFLFLPRRLPFLFLCRSFSLRTCGFGLPVRSVWSDVVCWGFLLWTDSLTGEFLLCCLGHYRSFTLVIK